MTILTKPFGGQKKSGQDVPLVAAEQPLAAGDAAPEDKVVVLSAVTKSGKGTKDRDVEKLVNVTIRNQTRVNSATTVCLFLVGLLVMSIGIVGGIYLYQQCARKPMQRLRGILNVPYDNAEGRQLFYHLDSQAQQMSASELSSKKNGYFSEQFEADGAYEQIDVPEFEGGRRGQFIHDFKFNKTGIVDVGGKRCFVIPLDRDAVVFLPSYVIDIARHLASRGSDVKVIVKTMRVAFPPMTDISTLGVKIAQECAGMNVYSLVKANIWPVVKRSAEEPVVFSSFSGSTMKVEIVNYKEVEEAEKERIDGLKKP